MKIASVMSDPKRNSEEGVSCGCATVFDATDEVAVSGLPLLADNAVPGTTGLPSPRKWLVEGRQILIF